MDIYIRGYNERGEVQADDFQVQLISTFKMLVKNPDIGRAVHIRPQLKRNELKP